MDTLFRWEVDVQTGEKKQISLTPEELVLNNAAKIVADAAQTTLLILQQRKTQRQNLLDGLLDKIEADPTILMRL